MPRLFSDFCKDERGATAIEHGMLVALFCVAVLFAARSVSSSITNIFTTAGDTMANGN